MHAHEMNLRGCLSAARSWKLVLHCAAILLSLPILFLSQTNAQTRGDAVISIESATGSSVLILGDTATFNIMINTRGEDIYGSTAYLSVPDSVFTPVFNLASYTPFIPGTWINAPAHQNNTHNDSLGQDTDNLPGIQYNYSQSSLVGGDNNTRTGTGLLAQFRLVPHTIPNNPAGAVTLAFDNTAWNSRETKYQELPTGSSPPIFDSRKYSQYLSLTVIIAGCQSTGDETGA